MHQYKELKVWKKAIKLAGKIYKLSSQLPESEKFGLVRQLQRAVASISLNISEGAGRSTNKDFSRFLDMAIGSTFEVQNCLHLFVELDFFNENQLEPFFLETNEIVKMLSALQQSLK